MVPVQVGAGVGVVGERVHPVADQRPHAGVAASLLDPEGRVDVGIAPAGDLEHRAFERVVVGGQRPAPPVGAVGLLADPREQPRRRVLEARAPLVPPFRTAERGQRRHRVHAQLADGVLALLTRGDAPAADMDVVAIPVVGGVHRQDRAEVRRTELCHLDRGEAPVADAPHADAAVAPGLRGEPFDGVVAVLGLGLGVLVLGDTRGAARATDVEPAQREPPGREPLPARDVRVAAPVVLAVRDHLEDRREPRIGLVRARAGQPQVG